MDQVNDIIIKNLPNKKKNSGEWININCPACIYNGERRPDHRYRGGFHFSPTGEIKYHCFNCGYKTGYTPGHILPKKMQNLLYWMGIDNETIRKLTFDTWRFSNNKGQQESKNNNFWVPNFSETQLPEMSTDIRVLLKNNERDQNFLDVCDYIINHRKLDITKLELYWSPSKDHGINRSAIIPFYWGRQIVGWVSRKIDKNIKNRYYGETPKDFIFNCNTLYLNRRKYIVIVEGIFDALSINCVAALGNKLNSRQIEWINSFNKNVIVVPDFNKEGKNLIDIALNNDWFISVPQISEDFSWNRKINDVDEARINYGSLYTLTSILENRTQNKTYIKTIKNFI